MLTFLNRLRIASSKICFSNPVFWVLPINGIISFTFLLPVSVLKSIK